MSRKNLPHLQRLEALSIHIVREVAADATNPVIRSIRFQTVGCYPLTGAVGSTAKTLQEVIQKPC